MGNAPGPKITMGQAVNLFQLILEIAIYIIKHNNQNLTLNAETNLAHTIGVNMCQANFSKSGSQLDIRRRGK